MKRPEETIRIPLRFGKSLILRFFDRKDIRWLRGEIFSLLSGQKGDPVQSSRFSRVLRFENPGSGELFYFKEYHDRGVKDAVKSVFGYTRGKRELFGGRLLLSRGFQTPAPILFGFEKTLFVIRKNFLITRGVPGESTYQYFRSRFSSPLSAEMIAEKRALIYSAGHRVGRLHGEGISHGDLRVGNIIIDGGGSSASFFFVDNERTRCYRALPDRERMKNLVQLNMVRLPQITTTDRLRFLNAYIEENAHLKPCKKELAMEIRYLTGKRQADKICRGEPLKPDNTWD